VLSEYFAALEGARTGIGDAETDWSSNSALHLFADEESMGYSGGLVVLNLV
jgi:hypothetical protein